MKSFSDTKATGKESNFRKDTPLALAANTRDAVNTYVLLLLLSAFFWCSNAVAQEQCQAEEVVFYFNGILNTFPDAEFASDAVQRAVTGLEDEGSCPPEFVVAYNGTREFWDDMT